MRRSRRRFKFPAAGFAGSSRAEAFRDRSKFRAQLLVTPLIEQAGATAGPGRRSQQLSGSPRSVTAGTYALWTCKFQLLLEVPEPLDDAAIVELGVLGGLTRLHLAKIADQPFEDSM